MNKNEESTKATSLDELWGEPKPSESDSSPLEPTDTTDSDAPITRTAASLPDERLTEDALEELLNKLPFIKFIENVDLSVRTYNSLMAALVNEAVAFRTIGDYWHSNEEDQNIMLKLEGLGNGSKEDVAILSLKTMQSPKSQI